MKLLGWDTETTGLDICHGARPFMLSVTDENLETLTWVWEVDPKTRRVLYDKNDLAEIKKLARRKDCRHLFHNAKFDIRMIVVMLGCNPFDYSLVDDTVLSSHLLYSSADIDLTSVAIEELGLCIRSYEADIKAAAQSAQSMARRRFPGWKVAKAALEETPNAKNSPWAFDMWLPAALAKKLKYPKTHPWYNVCTKYNTTDTTVLVEIFKSQQAKLKERGLLPVYHERLKLIPVLVDMESAGISYNRKRAQSMLKEYSEEMVDHVAACKELSGGFLTTMPKGGSSNAELRYTLFGHFKLKANLNSKKTGEPSSNKKVIQYWLDTLPPKSKARTFVEHLAACRQRGAACQAITSYEKVSRLSLEDRLLRGLSSAEWRRLYASLNPTGTSTLRFTSSNPNEQNFSKKKGFNIRYILGPLPGREWYSQDYENIELRLPAYEADEREMIRLFEHHEEAPYFGSYHLLVSHVLHPKEFEACLREGVSFKDRYKDSLYQQVKNGNFAVQYGAVHYSGTADLAYGIPGAQLQIEKRFKRISKLNKRMIEYAQSHGYVMTMTDKEVGSGYPLECEFNNGRVKPTVPLNYHIQGTAMWCMCKAMVRCHNYLAQFPDYKIIMQVHDELVFDFPICKGDKNKNIILHLQKLMQQSGDDVSVPLRTTISHHKDNYAEESKIAA